MTKQNLNKDGAKSLETSKNDYRMPELVEVGSAVELVQGGGGASGLDRSYYRIFLPNEF